MFFQLPNSLGVKDETKYQLDVAVCPEQQEPGNLGIYLVPGALSFGW